MSSNMPIVRQINWLSIVFQIFFHAVFISFFWIIFKNNFLLFYSIFFLMLVILLRFLLAKDHRLGVHYYKKQEYDKAENHFNKSYIFFTKYPWIDKYRFLFLLSNSKISYTEMALINRAFCLCQLGKKEEGISIYEDVLEKYPDNKIAESSLKMLR